MRTRTARRRAALAGVLAGGLLLTGCGASPQAELNEATTTLIERANDGDAEGVRSAAEALAAVVRRQAGADLDAAEVRRLLALIEDITAGADLLEDEPEPTPEPTTEEPEPEPTTEEPEPEPTTQAPTEEPTIEAPEPEPTTEAPTQEPTEEPTSEEPTGTPTSTGGNGGGNGNGNGNGNDNGDDDDEEDEDESAVVDPARTSPSPSGSPTRS